jgi:fatty-acyl-CoA synthase
MFPTCVPGEASSVTAVEEWSFVAVADIVAASVPDREMVVCGEKRRTFAEIGDRSRSLAAFLLAREVGLRAERDGLERWESGQDPVALLLHNSVEYIEAMFGAFRARAVPFNVNQHYRSAEIGGLFADVGVRAVVYHRRYGPLLETVLEDHGNVVLVDVDDGSGVSPLPGSVGFEIAAGTTVIDPLPECLPDDLYLVCTGGTTGRPKAVLWRQADVYISAMAGNEGTTADSIASLARSGAAPSGPWYPVAPLMHAAAQWTAFSGLNQGATVVLHEDIGAFDPRAVLELAEREHVALMSIVGDAYAGPLVNEMRQRRYDLSSLVVLGTGGAATNERHKEALVEMLPHLMIRDGYGSSETGGMAYGARTKKGGRPGFDPSPGAAVVSADRSRFLEPGDQELGWTARRGRVPLGYLGDRVRTEETFPIVDGQRIAIPGDRARFDASGRILVLGRDSMVVNTGGEKVFVEEVEEVLRRHPDITDALVVGRPSERFGQEVVAVVAPREGVDLDLVALREFAAVDIARFKAPRAVAVVDRVQRHANGKPDYAWAQDVALSARNVAGH